MVVYSILLVDLSHTFYYLPKPLLVYGSMLLLSTLINTILLQCYCIVVVLGYDWELRVVINITCLNARKWFCICSLWIPLHDSILVVYILLFTQAPIPVCFDGTIIDSRTILVTMYYCG